MTSLKDFRLGSFRSRPPAPFGTADCAPCFHTVLAAYQSARVEGAARGRRRTFCLAAKPGTAASIRASWTDRRAGSPGEWREERGTLRAFAARRQVPFGSPAGPPADGSRGDDASRVCLRPEPSREPSGSRVGAGAEDRSAWSESADRWAGFQTWSSLPGPTRLLHWLARASALLGRRRAPAWRRVSRETG